MPMPSAGAPGCYALNQGSIKAFQKVGFIVEGVCTQRFYVRSTYIDEVLLGLVKTDETRRDPTDLAHLATGQHA
jgi:hypothetical protein